ncbi:hypothetical protein HHL22_17775 [Hymenobacter sp. RP-2-7]|uniref:Uncharacterized protein n=1 Tax=Hymenobacter polaris TaxID=2682546 RepID=A0A7Y0AGW7_9BACT|nr:hypothetical protein [Hymenobacter polaris]NML67059.1 hypothetical protein [Hymenobacter polaris]
MRSVLLTLLLASLPIVLGYYLNASAPPPTSRYERARCTRYCAAHGCRHATRANSPAYYHLRPLYVATVRGLHAGGAGNYVLMNILFYLLLLPILLVWLTYAALRDARRLRQLRRYV